MSEKTTNRLKEVADLLAMVEEIMGSPLSGKSSISAGMKITVRNARESVIRSCIEVHREATEKGSSDPITHLSEQSEPAAQVAPQPLRGLMPEITKDGEMLQKDAGDPMGFSDRLLNRKRDLRASIERMVDGSE
jgi:hypothetical protein